MIRTFASHPALFGALVDLAATGSTAAVMPDFKILRMAARIARSGG
jgi:hypothetical protein